MSYCELVFLFVFLSVITVLWKMSSVMDKSNLPAQESRSKMFLRSNSFQKLCSLAHPMSLKGFKSNREALKAVFESLIVTTRGAIQSVTYRILCFLFLTPFSKLVSEPLAAAVSSNPDKDGRLNTVRLILKLTLSMIVATDKAEVKCDNGRFDCSAADGSLDQSVECVDSAVQTESPKVVDPPAELTEQFFDCKEDSKPSSQELLHRLLESSPPSSSSSLDCSSRSLPQQQSATLRVIVYGCVLCLFVQLSALAYLLNVATRIPPGLVFLILSVGYIGYVMMRIVFNQCCPKGSDLVYTKPPASSSTTTTVALVKVATAPPKPKGIHPLLAAVSKQMARVMQDGKALSMVPAGDPRSTRISRSRSRTAVPSMLDSKTISKVKLF